MQPSTLNLASELQVNRVIVRNDPSSDFTLGDVTINEDMLLVQVEVALNEAFLINIESTPKMPIRAPFHELISAINAGSLDVVDMDWSDKVTRAFDQLSENEKAKAVSRYKTIAPLLEDLEGVIRNRYGEGIFQKIADDEGRSKQYVYDCFNGFFYYGQRLPALALPIGKNIFHKAKEERDIRVKQGRPNNYLAQGKVLEDFDFRAFEWGKRQYQVNNGPSIERCHLSMLKKFYYASRTRNTTEAIQRGEDRFKVKLKPVTEYPTLDQFYWWLKKEFNGVLPKRDKVRHNATEYLKDLAGRTGDAFAYDDAFGKTFELDETPFDEELVSQYDETRSTKIGKATLYFVVDRFSRYIVGIYITVESPSFKTARQAIFNAATDKTRFLEEYGFEPGEVRWDYHGVPTSLFVDNAELRNRLSEESLCDLAIKANFARGGRGDDKPHVEQMFRVFSEWFEGFSKAHQTKSLADISKQLARKHAALNMTELYIIAIVYINYHNNYRRIDDYPFTKEMLKDDVQPIPAEICAWGQKYRPGHILKYDERDLYRSLLPANEVSVHQDGIYFPGAGLWYNCEFILESGLQDRLKSQNCVGKLRARYNENLVDAILIETSDGLKLATLDVHCQAFEGMSFYEVIQQKKAMAKESAKAKPSERERMLGVVETMEKLLKDANGAKIPSAMPQIAQIKVNRKHEELFNRYSDIDRYLNAIQGEGWQSEPEESESKNPNSKSVYDDFEDDSNE